MNDLFHEWGSDLVVGSGGDLTVSTGADTISQRVYRRLLTNAGDYIWNLSYGGGLAQFVGQPANAADIEAIIQTQIGLETVVPTTPAPQVTVGVVDPANGYIVAGISYADPGSLATVQINISAS